jgi:aerobic-type carbon monoxide dehydrogenase small subunit (CoxS/CutS family)
MTQSISFRLNHESVDLSVDGERMLVWVLRTDLELTGTKWGCEIGLCGACTVLVDDKAVLACQTPVKDVHGKHVITIEGLARNGNLHPLQKAFVEHDALQCGFCTPGMILNAYSLLTENIDASDEEIIRGMDENLCRCGAHTRILDAIRDAAREMKGARS